jgi:methionine aminotransferase
MPVMTRDWGFCRWLALEYGVVSIPTSAFYGPPIAGEGGREGGRKSLVRFTFCKTDETLDAAAAAFRRLGQDQRRGGGEGGGGKDVQ